MLAISSDAAENNIVSNYEASIYSASLLLIFIKGTVYSLSPNLDLHWQYLGTGKEF